MKIYVGEDFAKEHGYTLLSYTPNDNNDICKTCWVKEGLFLDICFVDGKLMGKLTKIFGLVECKVGEFSIPNKNFEMFEKQINSIVMKAN
jgi:hypothetical protein